MRARSRVATLFGVLAATALLSSCGPKVETDGEGDGDGVPTMPPQESGPSNNLEPNGTARVTADFLNLRDMVGTSGTILVAMPCGASVKVLEGPSPDPIPGWWHVNYVAPDTTSYTGWASGKLLIGAADFDESTCGMMSTSMDGGVVAPPMTLATEIFDRAKLAVGYSYWWGHGAWETDQSQLGTCNGSCPSCTHTGAYGADCSGFVAKVWQVPSASALGVDEHPYSTYNFYNDQTYWTQIDRANLQPADALVRRDSTSGHIALFEMGDDPFGATWLYEARACAVGIVHNLRTADSSYRAIRRNGL